MHYGRHRHFFKLERRWNSPPGYLFRCNRCTKAGLYAHKFIRYEQFWTRESA